MLGARTYPYEQPPRTYPSVRRQPLVGHVVAWPDGHGKVLGIRWEPGMQGDADERVLEVWHHTLHDTVEVPDGPGVHVATTPLCSHCPAVQP